MGLKNFKIWGVFLVAIVVIAFMLFQQSNTNRKELEGQAVRNLELVRQNFKVYFDSHVANILQERRRELLDAGINNFEKVKVTKVTLNDDSNNKTFLTVGIDKNLERRIDFEHLFSKINHQGFFGKVLLSESSGKIIYPKAEAGKFLPDFKSKKWDTYHLPIIKETILHDNQDYLIYYTPVDIGSYQFYISGLIKNSYFESIGKKVDFSNLTFLVFLLSMMMFSIPVISFFGLSKGDKVTMFGIYSIGLSMVGIMVLMGFGFAFFQNHHPIKPEDHDLAMDEIRNNLCDHIQEKHKILDYWDTSKVGQYNDLVSIKEDKSIYSMFINGKPQINQKFRYLGHRQYFRYFLSASDTNSFDKSKKGHYYIGSHYSLDSSKLESVISTLHKNGKVNIVTFYWKNRLTNFDKKRGYLLFKDDGLILHKSSRVKIIADSLSQLLSTVSWKEVNGIVRSNFNNTSDQKWEIPIYLDGHAFVATLMPVYSGLQLDKTIWMLYLQDEHLEHVYSSLVTFESMFFLLLYLGVLGLISLANKLNKSKSKISPIKKFAYDYLFPKPSMEKSFVILIRYLSTYVFIILYFYHLKEIDFFGMFLILMISTFHIKVLMYIWLRPIPSPALMNPNDFREKVIKAKSSLHVFIWIMGIVIFITFWFLWYFVHPIQFFVFFIWVLTSSFLSFKSRLKNIGKNIGEKKEDHSGFQLLYISFLVMWLVMVGFIPGYVIYSKIHRYEMFNWEPSKDNTTFIIPSDFWTAYEESRRFLFNNLTSVEDSQVNEFVFPNREQVQPDHSKAVLNISFFETYWEKFSSSPIKFFGISFLLLLTVGSFSWLVKKLADYIYLLDYTYFLFGNKAESAKSTPTSPRIFLCGIDSALFNSWVKDNFLFDTKSILNTDCTSNQELAWGTETLPNLEGKSIWMINNIHCLENQAILVKKLPLFIEAANGKVKLILSSGLSWKELLKNYHTNKEQVLYSQIFSDFHFEYVPIVLPQGLDKELNSEEESSVLIRSMKAYFFNIWEELSFEEKKVCYYFSKEGFFNYSNKSVITELIQKGVLVRETRDELPKLFHRVFRQFILYNITDEEKAEFKSDESKNGNAGSIQLAVFSFILLSVALISYFDKTFLDQATTFVTAITGALSGIYSLFSKGIAGLRGKSET